MPKRVQNTTIMARGKAGAFAPWRDEATLREKYNEYGTLKAVAEELGCSFSTVRRWMEKFEIDRYGSGTRPSYPPYKTRVDGYVYVGSTYAGYVSVPHLIAIAEGVSPRIVFSEQWDVHHENGIPWDNRWDNISILSHRKHGELEARKRHQD